MHLLKRPIHPITGRHETICVQLVTSLWSKEPQVGWDICSLIQVFQYKHNVQIYKEQGTNTFFNILHNHVTHYIKIQDISFNTRTTCRPHFWKSNRDRTSSCVNHFEICSEFRFLLHVIITNTQNLKPRL